MVTVVVAWHPTLSVTVTDQTPDVNPVQFAVLCAGAGSFHKYVYPGVPPDAVTVALPLLPPLQLTFVCEVIVAVGAPVLFTFIVVVAVQLLLSVTVTVYAPAVIFVIELVVPPFDQL